MYLVLLCSASFGLTPLVVEEVASGSVRRRVVVDGERTSTYFAPRWGGAVRSTFVPTGTVAQEYVRYQLYHVAQDLSTQLRATLATTAVFSGLGLGASKTMGAAAATLVFLSRDASGMATSLIAASRLAPKLGGDARRFRFAGDVAVDIALLCELLSPRKFFIVLLCVASVLKALCGVLAGGERARLLLARLFARPSNVLVLDEPTNDLDLETLDLLEDLLGEYPGTVLLVSHDRAFLDNVVSSTFAFEGDGIVNEYVGGYADWLRQKQRQQQRKAEASKPKQPTSTSNGKPRGGKTKLSYKEQRELDSLPGQIETLEVEQGEIHAAMAQPDFYTQGADVYETTQKRLNELVGELEAAYERWDELETLRAELEAARA